MLREWRSVERSLREGSLKNLMNIWSIPLFRISE
jgi:hypothetical protein